MAIRILKFQPVLFRSEAEIEAENCACTTKPFCQLVNKNDATQWQLQTDNDIVNGNFVNGLDGWGIGVSIIVTGLITNESADGDCDGSIEVTATGGIAPYEYSKDGLTFQSSNILEDLCVDCYNVIVRDANGNTGTSGPLCVSKNIDCSDYAGSETNDLLIFNTNDLLNCFTNDFI